MGYAPAEGEELPAGSAAAAGRRGARARAPKVLLEVELAAVEHVVVKLLVRDGRGGRGIRGVQHRQQLRRRRHRCVERLLAVETQRDELLHVVHGGGEGGGRGDGEEVPERVAADRAVRGEEVHKGLKERVVAAHLQRRPRVTTTHTPRARTDAQHNSTCGTRKLRARNELYSAMCHFSSFI